MKAAVYLRISEDRLGLELGVDRQREDCTALAAARGWGQPREFVDNDLSASNGVRRPGYEALMAAVRAGAVNRVLVWHTSRIWRNRTERAAGIETFRAARVSLLAVRGPELDMATAAGRGMAGLLGEFDTWESEVKAERSQREVIQRAERGAHHGGPRAHGYTADGAALVTDEAQQVAGWYTAVLAGRSITALARGAGRHHSSLRAILLNPRNAGLRVLHGVEYAGAWPAIVTPETWRAAVSLLTDPARRTNHGQVARRWLGSGIYGCGRCDAQPVIITYTGASNGGRPVYVCSARRGGCSRTWNAPRLDEFVGEVVAARLGKPDVADLLPKDRPDLERLRTEGQAIRQRLQQAAADWVRLGLDEAQLRRAGEAGRARLAEIEHELSSAGNQGVLGPLILSHDPVVAWRAIPAEHVDRRQAVVRALMSVTLGASPRGRAPWDPQRFVAIGWRTDL